MLSWDKTPALSPMRCARAWIEIDLTALAHNVSQLRALLPQETDLMSVVKADAYGHGAVAVAKVALQSGATWLGVATVPEGIELRQNGIRAPILVMGAVNEPVEVRAMVRWQLQPTIVSLKQALMFSKTLAAYYGDNDDRDEATLPVHLKLDTGMSRLGYNWQQPIELAQFIQQLAHLEAVSLYSHFATADSPDTTVMNLQHARFQTAIAALRSADLLPPRLHIANSAATLADRCLHYDMVRVGLATYGLYPAPHLKSKISLRPALSVKAKITHINHIEAGAGVSYDHKFVAPKAMTIAVVGIGYADGVPRVLSNRIWVSIAGKHVRQLGAITMDQLMLDVSDIPAVRVGDVVTLLGPAMGSAESKTASTTEAFTEELSVDHWAELAGTISWEILCGFKHRLPRTTAGGTSAKVQANQIAGTSDNHELVLDYL